jgi:hypothetical protein
MLRNRAWQQAFERLERLEGKLSRAVLRGREVSNGLLLPDLKAVGEKGGCLEGPHCLACDAVG